MNEAEELLLKIEKGLDNCHDYKEKLIYTKVISEEIKNYFGNKR